MEKLAAPRGTADLYPPESARWQALESRIHAIARRFGYGEIRTPTFEATELFRRGVGEATDVVEKEMYTFTDRSGRSLTLRPEFTAPVVRALLEHHLLAQGPQRLYYVGPFYRYERPQKGRLREPHQFGVECFGYADPEADVEVMHIAAELLRAYAVEATLELNSIGDAQCRPRYREALLGHFGPHRNALSEDSQRRLDRNPLRLLDSKAPEDQALIETAPHFESMLCDACAEHFARVRTLLDATGLRYRVNPRVVRGFDYYTRTVFEFVSSALGSQNSVCGGGRYDDLVATLGGPATPGVGFGLGIERFLMVVDASGKEPVQRTGGIAAIALGEAARTQVFPLVSTLRRISDGIPVTMEYADAKIGAQFKRAERTGARAALIVGEDEVAEHRIALRDLERRVQTSLQQRESLEATATEVLAWYRDLPESSQPDSRPV
ncbi:MAG: histidine--tRNA ligase [Candidatus Eremiobacteraeota bacterium]|nr:histidine--tRNA ligase [Candidatus Eremiobacteraeota bacterium]